MNKVKNITICEQIEHMAKSPILNLNKIIAEELRRPFVEKELDFLSIKNLSVKCNCSLAAITKFAKQFGFSGYQELVFNLVNEKNKFDFRIPNKKSDKKYNFQYINDVLKWIEKNDLFIENFLNALKETDIVYIYGSPQTRPATKYLSNVLTSLNKIPVLINPLYTVDQIKKNFKNHINLFLITGRSSQNVVEYFLNIQDEQEDKNTFLISTINQIGKIKKKYKNQAIIDFESDNSNYIFRNIFFHILFITVFENY